jgi:hypothetical protein
MTIEETPCRATSSIRWRNCTVLPEPLPAKTAVCLRSSVSGTVNGLPVTMPVPLTPGHSGSGSALS